MSSHSLPGGGARMVAIWGGLALAGILSFLAGLYSVLGGHKK